MADENTPAPDNKPEVPLTIGDTPAVGDGLNAKPKADAPITTDEVVAYEPTGDVGLDMALDFVGKAGVGIDHPAMVAAQQGDFALLKATLAQKGVAGWEQFVALGEAAYEKVAKDNKAKADAARDAIYKEVGGEESWLEIQKWAGANATAEEKAEINKLLGQGGLAAKGAVKYLADAYAKAGNVTREPANPLADAGRANGGGANAPLNSADYSAEVAKLHRKLGGRMEDSREYASLRQRRAAYRG